jgi:hypothetical protein
VDEKELVTAAKLCCGKHSHFRAGFFSLAFIRMISQDIINLILPSSFGAKHNPEPECTVCDE